MGWTTEPVSMSSAQVCSPSSSSFRQQVWSGRAGLEIGDWRLDFRCYPWPWSVLPSWAWSVKGCWCHQPHYWSGGGTKQEPSASAGMGVSVRVIGRKEPVRKRGAGAGSLLGIGERTAEWEFRIPFLLFTSCLLMGKTFQLSESYFPHPLYKIRAVGYRNYVRLKRSTICNVLSGKQRPL